MSYPRRTRERALEIYLARPDRSSRTAGAIAAVLAKEGHGKVSITAINRWVRENPLLQAGEVSDLSRRISLAAALGTGDVLQGVAAVLEDNGDLKRIIAATGDLAALVSTVARRAGKLVAQMELGSVDDFEALTRCLVDLSRASLDATRAVRDLRGLNVTSNFRDADSAAPVDPAPVKPALAEPSDSPFAHLLQPSNFAEAE